MDFTGGGFETTPVGVSTPGSIASGDFSMFGNIADMWSKVKGAFGNGGSLATGTANYGGANPATMPDGTPNAMAGDKGSILGMSPNQFSSLVGGLGSAIAPKDSWQEKIGTFARGLGVAQLGMAATKAKAAADLKYFNTLMEKGLVPKSFLKDLDNKPTFGLNKGDAFGVGGVAENPEVYK